MRERFFSLSDLTRDQNTHVHSSYHIEMMLQSNAGKPLQLIGSEVNF